MHDGKEPAYTCEVPFDDGTNDVMKRRERPQLLLSAEGEPWYLSNGVQPEAGSDRVFTLVLPIAQEQQ